MQEHKELDRLREFIARMNETNSSTVKMDVLRLYANDDFIRQVLYYTYNPYLRYGVTPANLEKHSDKCALGLNYSMRLFELLDMLHERNYTGFAAIEVANRYVADNFLYTKEIMLVFARNLKIKIDVSQINKVFPGLIPEFSVALAEKIDDARKKKSGVDFVRDVWIGSRKLDGLRCIMIIDDDGEVTPYSREGHPFNTLQKLVDEVKRWGLRGIVLDGEVCLMDAAGNEDFAGIQKQYRKKDHTIENPRYCLFDILSLGDFEHGTSTLIFSERYTFLKDTVAKVKANPQLIKVITQGRIKSQEHLDALMEEASRNGWEGMILRRDVPYVGKRSFDLLKVKNMHDAEYRVKSLETGPINAVFYRDSISKREVELEDGEYRYKDSGDPVLYIDLVETFTDTREMVTKLVIEHKGNDVGVGSGLSMLQRRRWYEKPEEIVGKVVTIKYFQETDVDGRKSLRFPILKCVHGDERDA